MTVDFYTAGLSVLFGAVVGFSLGLTGGGGSVFAVPLLVYGLSMPPREAVGVSLAAVGAMALVGATERLSKRQVEVRPGLIFAIAGMVGAPLGSWLAGQMAEAVLLALFSVLMLVVAVRMWLTSTAVLPARDETADGPSCRRDAVGNLLLTSRCAVVLSVVGVMTGIFSGLFGVGGGFIIVPALVLFSGMSVHRAIATSMFVMTLISVSGVSGHLLAGRTISASTTVLFVIGGVGAIFVGNVLGRRISGPALQKGFAVAIMGVAAFVFAQAVVFGG
jgi:uncharacterized protein